ncbi:MAG: TonB-dependent receptor plug domain-containing protein [Deltaproteobacteria bacterium]|nr:TonB-dependent receptor plug domain-containing protein [Deltaproteobacteria bacterium]
MRRRMNVVKPYAVVFCVYSLLLGSVGEFSVPAYAEGPELADMSLEALMNLEVTSVSKREELARHAAAAVFVLTNEDIRRSGATSIPEALRLVPGLNVAKIDSSRWAITARGFNGLFASKLLVLIDGRSVYTPLFSGVNWDVQDTVIEDIERIEVIRGPGASLWGSNAVNGVINIITKNAADTNSGLAAVSAGNVDRLITTFRYGEQISENASARGYVKYLNRDNSPNVGPGDDYDQWDMWRGGTRLDWKKDDQAFLFELEGYGGNEGSRANIPQFTPPYSEWEQKTGYAAGGHVLGRWEGAVSEDTTAVFQGYYDQTDREELILRQVHDTVDLDSQAQTRLDSDNTLLYGANYRFVHDNLRSRNVASFDPVSRDTTLVSAFLQNEMQVIPEELKIILGTKVEHNDFTGFEFEPNARTVWNFAPKQTLWAAVSRATRTPNRAETDITLISSIQEDPASGLPVEAAIMGNRNLSSEDLLATEIGYRAQPWKSLSVDVALFYNHYKDLGSFTEQEAQFSDDPVPHIVVPLRNEDGLLGDTFGGEFVADILPISGWRLQASYSFIRIATAPEEGADVYPVPSPESQTPTNQILLRSLIDLPYDLELDSMFRYVDSVPAYNVNAYTEATVRLGWKYSENLEFSFLVQNAFEPNHQEYAVDLIQAQPAEVRRSYLGKITWRF